MAGKKANIGFSYDDTGKILKKYKGTASEVKVPDGIVEIATGAFEDKYMKIVYIPDSVNVINSPAFYECSGLKEVSIPGDLEISEENIFLACPKAKVVRRASAGKKASKNIPQKKAETDYKKLFIEYIKAEDLSAKEKLFENISDSEIKMELAFVLMSQYKSAVALEYIKQNYKEILQQLVDKDDIKDIEIVVSVLKNKKE